MVFANGTSGILEKQGFDYAVERRNGKRIVTDQHVLITVEGAMKEIHFAAISNSTPTEVCWNLHLNIYNTNAYRLRSQITRTP